MKKRRYITINNPKIKQGDKLKQSLGESEVSNNQHQVDGSEATSVSLAEKKRLSSPSTIQSTKSVNLTPLLKKGVKSGMERLHSFSNPSLTLMVIGEKWLSEALTMSNNIDKGK